jgi:hypothetical protein
MEWKSERKKVINHTPSRHNISKETCKRKNVQGNEANLTKGAG